MSLEHAPDTTMDQFLEIVQSEDVLQIREFLNNQNISDVAELIDELPDYESQIIGNMSTHRAASTFKILDVPTQKRIIQELPAFTTAELLDDLSADDRTSCLEELPSEVVKELIKTLDPEERKITLSLLGYHESSVGRLMTPDYIAAQKEFTEDIQKIGGTEALDEPYLEIPLLKLFKKRIVWLVVLFLGEMLTATAMGYFEDEIAKAVVLSLFVPLIISSGGNSGSQASTLIIQAMALGESTIPHLWRAARQKILPPVLLGPVLRPSPFTP